MDTTNVKWVAELTHVREVSLLGGADLAYWTSHLRPQRLVPLDRDGRARILIIAADARFRRIRFQELSFSVLIASHEAGHREDQAYLVQAFNSCRFFAFCERWVFRTPYDYGNVGVSTSGPASMHLVDGDESLFRAAMSANVPHRTPCASGDGGWEGPVFLPGKPRGTDSRDRFFHARIRGRSTVFPFVPSDDVCGIRAGRRHGVLDALVASGFAALQWTIREDATHAKSKTYTRETF